MRKFVILVLSALLLLSCITLSGCKYVSSFSATILVQSNTSDSGFMRFDSFTGTYVFKFKCTEESSGTLNYKAKLNSGHLKVYYDNDSEKKELFTLKSNETIESSIDSLKEGTIYVIVETDGKCQEGDLSFSLE